ncbi:hypothetical protein N665_0156s0020 [Sinapis alba]|nr:hypothetical protein N665_0156s0020 [Sinapis alba]
MFLSSRRSRSHQPRRNRSSDEPARASGSFAEHARALHAPPPEIVSAAAPPPDRRAPPSPPVSYPIWSLFE